MALDHLDLHILDTSQILTFKSSVVKEHICQMNREELSALIPGPPELYRNRSEQLTSGKKHTWTVISCSKCFVLKWHISSLIGKNQVLFFSFSVSWRSVGNIVCVVSNTLTHTSHHMLFLQVIEIHTMSRWSAAQTTKCHSKHQSNYFQYPIYSSSCCISCVTRPTLMCQTERWRGVRVFAEAGGAARRISNCQGT